MSDANNPSLREAMELEQHLISPKDWTSHRDKVEGMPDHLRRVIFGGASGGGPTGFGYAPDKGYFVLAAGQGPSIMWAQWLPDTH